MWGSSEFRLPSSTSFMPRMPQVPDQPPRPRSARIFCKSFCLVDRAHESLASQEVQRLGTLGYDLGDGARNVGVDLVVLLGAAARIERDLRDEELAVEGGTVDVVGKAGLVLDHETVQLGSAAEDRPQPRFDFPLLSWTSLVHGVTISPTGGPRHDESLTWFYRPRRHG